MSDRIAVLASGSGSNLQALIDAALPIAVVIVNRPKARALERARAANIPAVLIDHKRFDGRAEFESALLAELERHGVNWVVLAGFMRVLGSTFLSARGGRIVNIHPSLLPAFPGLHAQRQAVEAGVRLSGCTVHLVDEGVDSGPILAQTAVPVLPEDDEQTLSRRILTEEHRLLPAVMRSLLEDGLHEVRGRPALKRSLQ